MNAKYVTMYRHFAIVLWVLSIEYGQINSEQTGLRAFIIRIPSCLSGKTSSRRFSDYNTQTKTAALYSNNCSENKFSDTQKCLANIKNNFYIFNNTLLQKILETVVLSKK